MAFIDCSCNQTMKPCPDSLGIMRAKTRMAWSAITAMVPLVEDHMWNADGIEPAQQAQGHVIVLRPGETRIELSDGTITFCSHQHRALPDKEVLHQHDVKCTTIPRLIRTPGRTNSRRPFSVENIQGAIGKPRSGMRHQGRIQPLQSLGTGNVIIIEYPGEGLANQRKPKIKRPGLSAVFRAYDANPVAIAFENVHRVVRRTINDDNDFRRQQGLLKETVKRLTDQVAPIVGRDNDAYWCIFHIDHEQSPRTSAWDKGL